MCDKNQLHAITTTVAAKSAELLNTKLQTVILYGSYARGDYDEQSDIDIMILADIPADLCWKYTSLLADCLTDLELCYDVVISAHIVSSSVFDDYRHALPFYRNVDQEGIRIAV